MRVVLDTNLLLSSISSKSASHWLYQGIGQGAFTLCVTTEILNEYAELITRGFKSRGPEVADAVLEALINCPTVSLTTVFYQWGLITVDYDDNKFVDCAIAAQANYLVTADRHFDVLASIDFPRVQVVSLEQFRQVIEMH